MATDLDLRVVWDGVHSNVRTAFIAGDPVGVVTCCSHQAMDLLMLNKQSMSERGILEAAVLHAITSVRHQPWPPSQVESLLASCDRDRLRKAGELLPITGPMTIYRGVGNKPHYRIARGCCWTLDASIARWFASFYSPPGYGHEPVVYMARVNSDEVYAYTSYEKTVLVRPKLVTRLSISEPEIRATAEAVQLDINKGNQKLVESMREENRSAKRKLPLYLS